MKTEPIENTWSFDEDRRVLLLSRESYEVPLENLVTSARVLDSIVHVAENIWATPDVVAGFVSALDELFHLEENLCGGGAEKGPIDAKATLAHVAEERLERRRDLDQVRETVGIPMYEGGSAHFDPVRRRAS